MSDADLNYGYLGYSEVTKEILDNLDIEPELVISFIEEIEEKYGRGVSYDEYNSIQVETVNSSKAKTEILEHNIDVLLVMGWPELLKPELIDAPSQGCVGRHISYLPERRGRAPVAWALIHGLDETAVSLFWIDEGVDSGPIIEQKPVYIDENDHAEDLHQKCTDASIKVLNEDVLPRFKDRDFSAEPQNEKNATYTHPRRPDMGIIDWSDTASDIHNFIRGQSHPYPGAFTYHEMDKITMWRSRLRHETVTKEAPGVVIGKGDFGDWLIQCGEGVVDVEIEYSKGSSNLNIGDRLGAIPY